MAKSKPIKPALIPAVACLRKSTKGERPDGRERQEKSIGQQRREIIELAKGRYEIIRWYNDEGVSGWKRGDSRPDFDRMLRDAKEKRDFQAVLCDDLDRFSRAEVMEVFADLTTLAAGGVKTLHCVNQGEYKLGGEGDIGRIIKLVVDVHGGYEFSRKLGRRIALSRRNAAAEGRRSGGNAPYGLANDGSGGLKIGDEAKAATVRWLFDQFANKSRSLWSLAGELNEKATPTSRGRKWSAQTIKDILGNEAYRGDFTYNKKKTGRFFFIDENQQVKESSDRPESIKPWKASEDGIFRKIGAFKPLIEPALFDAAQRKLATLKSRTRRPRANAYVLTGVLRCDHCGKVMFGRTVEKHHNGKTYTHVEYRCQTYESKGKKECGYHTVREEKILPFVMRALGEEIDRLLLSIDQTRPYFGKFASGKGVKIWPRNMKGHGNGSEVNERAVNLQRQADELDTRIKLACDNILGCKSADVRQRLDMQVAAMIEEQKQLLAEVESAKADQGHASDDYEAVRQLLAQIPYRDGYVVSDGHSVRETLLSLGADVRLRWDSEDKVMRSGRVARYHTLTRGRIRLGQFSDKRTVRFCLIPSAGSNSDTPAADHSGSRRGRD